MNSTNSTCPYTGTYSLLSYQQRTENARTNGKESFSPLGFNTGEMLKG